MCGIFGYIGEKDPLNICLKGLERLEYRGYDSSGIGGITQGKIAICKAKGMLQALKEKATLPKLDVAIGHTRWATHGKVDDENAHPFTDASESFALIHNGIIENYKTLKNELLNEGVPFLSETDSEVIVNLIAKNFNGDLLQAVHKVVSKLEGSFAFLVIHKEHPDEIIAVANECPLSVGWTPSKKEAIISSDPNAFEEANLDIIFLEKKEVARVRKGHVEIFNELLKTVKKKHERLVGNIEPPSKDGYEHFMLKEIFEQPRVIQNTLLGRTKGIHFFQELNIELDALKKINRFSILGCGSSAHAGLLASYLIEDLAKTETRVEIASEARYRMPILNSNALAIAVSQSGETADLLAATRKLKSEGTKILALCNVKNSSLVRESENFFNVKAGPEISVCSTKAFTAQLSCLTLFAYHFAEQVQRVNTDSLFSELSNIPFHIEEILKRKDEIERIAVKYAAYDDFIFLGRNYMLPTAQEAALKLKEISYCNANAYPAGELKHGAIALLEEKFPVVAFCANEKTLQKMTSNLMEVKARKAPLFAIATIGSEEIGAIADDVFYIPKARDSLSPFSASVVGQLFAYFVARERGCDIDHPRNLAKSVTVE